MRCVYLSARLNLCERLRTNAICRDRGDFRGRFQPQATRRIVAAGMATYDSSGSTTPEVPPPGFVARIFLNTGHKAIGLRYLWLALGSVLTGMVLSLLMRIHLVWPGAQIPFLSGFDTTPERYTALTMFHGSLMVFLVLTTAPQAGFGNYFLPLQIGAREMAFPAINLFSFWATVASLGGMTGAFFVHPDAGLTLWTASVALFCLASLLTALNFIVTTLGLRAKGMTLPRMPLTVWAWLINAILSMLIFSILLAACAFLLSDRLLGSQFFSPLTFLSHQPGPLAQSTLLSLWQRLFWFFAQAEVYVAMLPCFGIVSHLLSTFSRKPVWAERAAVLALCGVGLFGFCVWGQHMFSSGLNPWSPLVFSLLASSLGLPACVLLLSWFGTLWNAKIHLNTAMLFALGFVSLFLSGGVSGLFLARNDLAAASISDEFVTGHSHLVMGVSRHIRHSGCPVFLVSKNVRAPSQRNSRQAPLLAHLRRSLLRIYAHALARPDGPLCESDRRPGGGRLSRVIIRSSARIARDVASHLRHSCHDSHPCRAGSFCCEFCLEFVAW